MNTTESNTRIPNLVHFVFGLAPQIEPFHVVHYLAIESCRRMVRPERIFFHYRYEPYGSWWERTRPHIQLVQVGPVAEVTSAPYEGDIVPERYRYAHEADFVRLDALVEHGGIYADLDTLFVRPYPSELRAFPFVLSREAPTPDERTGELRDSLCNALMAAEPNADFAKTWRAEMPAALNGTWNNHSGFLAAELARRLPDAVHIERQSTFFPFGATPSGIVQLLERDTGLPKETVSVHLCAHLWWEPGRRDFSDVHAGTLTPRRIRARDTTYNRSARRFLPSDTIPSPSSASYLSFHEQSGYAEAARRLMVALDELGVDVGYKPVGRGMDGRTYTFLPADAVHAPDLTPLVDAAARETVVAHLVPEYFPQSRREHPDAKLVGHTVWETDTLPKHWLPLLEIPDLLVVPCRWNAETISASGVSTPVAVIPHVATVPRRRTTPMWDAVGDDVFVFYTIATWTARKAVWNTVRAYLRAFRREDPVLLIVKTSQRDLTYLGPRTTEIAQPGTTAWATAHILKDDPDAPSVQLVTRELTDADVEALHTRGDCFVSLCRSEGWGIPAFDAAAYGNPVVITGFGGHLDYLDADTASLVDYTLVPVEDPVGAHSYTPDMRWAEPSIAHASELLRSIYSDPQAARDRAEPLSQRILVSYRPEAVAAAFLQALRSN